MAVMLGSKYAETRERLREAIRNGTISVLEIEAGNFSSYFTLKPIKENPIMLVEIDNENRTNPLPKGRGIYCSVFGIENFALKCGVLHPKNFCEIFNKNGTSKYVISREDYGACCPDSEKLLRFYEGSSSIN